MLLEVDNLNVYYGAIHALQGISFNLQDGEIVTLIGANGAGKRRDRAGDLERGKRRGGAGLFREGNRFQSNYRGCPVCAGSLRRSGNG